MKELFKLAAVITSLNPFYIMETILMKLESAVVENVEKQGLNPFYIMETILIKIPHLWYPQLDMRS